MNHGHITHRRAVQVDGLYQQLEGTISQRTNSINNVGTVKLGVQPEAGRASNNIIGASRQNGSEIQASANFNLRFFRVAQAFNLANFVTFKGERHIYCGGSGRMTYHQSRIPFINGRRVIHKNGKRGCASFCQVSHDRSIRPSRQRGGTSDGWVTGRRVGASRVNFDVVIARRQGQRVGDGARRKVRQRQTAIHVNINRQSGHAVHHGDDTGIGFFICGHPGCGGQEQGH